MKLSIILKAMALVVVLVVGPVTYFARMPQVIWLPYMLATILFALIPAVLALRAQEKARGHVALLPPIAIYVSLVVLSAAMNTSPPLQFLVGGKSLVAFLSVYALIALAPVNVQRLEFFWKWLIPIAIAQIPVVLYQYFFIASGRDADGASWDSVVGTFGGDPQGGGASGVLAFYLLTATFFAICLFKRKQITRWQLSGLALTAAVCMLLAEVKFAAVLLPIGGIIVAASSVRRNPIVSIGATVAAVSASLLLLNGYGAVHYNAGGQGSSSGIDWLTSLVAYSFDDQSLNAATGDMSRIAAIEFWWANGFVPDYFHGLFGYGPGASRSSSSFAVGEAASKYIYNLDQSAATQLLWDIGVLGTAAFVAILVIGFCASRKALLKHHHPFTQAALETSSVVLVLLMAMVPYSRDILEVPALSFLMVFVLGYVSLASRPNAWSVPRPLVSQRVQPS